MVNGRSAGTPERTAAEIRRETGGALIAVVADVATLKGQQTLLAAVPTVRACLTISRPSIFKLPCAHCQLLLIDQEGSSMPSSPCN
jgi:hypothetical protein